jgi:hypothetical protein
MRGKKRNQIRPTLMPRINTPFSMCKEIGNLRNFFRNSPKETSPGVGKKIQQKELPVQQIGAVVEGGE